MTLLTFLVELTIQKELAPPTKRNRYLQTTKWTMNKRQNYAVLPHLTKQESNVLVYQMHVKYIKLFIIKYKYKSTCSAQDYVLNVRLIFKCIVLCLRCSLH